MACGGADGWEGSESYELGELEQELSMASGLSATTAPNQLVLGTKLPNGPAYVRIPTVTTATAPHKLITGTKLPDGPVHAYVPSVTAATDPSKQTTGTKNPDGQVYVYDPTVTVAASDKQP